MGAITIANKLKLESTNKRKTTIEKCKRVTLEKKKIFTLKGPKSVLQTDSRYVKAEKKEFRNQRVTYPNPTFLWTDSSFYQNKLVKLV